MRYLLFVGLGMFLMFIVLKILSSNMVQSTSDLTLKLSDLVRTAQARNLIKTNEFRELIRTAEFKRLMLSLADEQAKVMSQALLNTTVKPL